jgi:hypothetical protein
MTRGAIPRYPPCSELHYSPEYVHGTWVRVAPQVNSFVTRLLPHGNLRQGLSLKDALDSVDSGIHLVRKGVKGEIESACNLGQATVCRQRIADMV